MNGSIWKYDLPRGRLEILLPKGAMPLVVGTQSNILKMWCHIPHTEAALTARVFRTFATGELITMDQRKLRYIGTGLGREVWHVFEEV